MLNTDSAILKCLRNTLESHFGWSLDAFHHGSVLLKVERWAASKNAGIDSVLKVITQNQKKPDIILEIASALAVNESYFFRGLHQLKWITEQVIPEILNRQEKVRIWSAGCANGEEPYSVAFLTAEKYGSNEWFNRISIVATDISRSAINKARKGIFSERSLAFRNTPRSLLPKFFTNVGQGLWQVRPEYRKGIVFLEDNLIVEDAPVFPGTINVCLCRNVLYYMTKRSKEKALAKISKALSRGGYVILGESEVVEERKDLGLSIYRDKGIFALRKD